MDQPSSSRLRDVRIAAGLSQRALADRLGVAQQHVDRWERGVVEPKVLMAVRLSEALGTTVNAIWQAPSQQKPKRTRAAGTAGSMTHQENA